MTPTLHHSIPVLAIVGRPNVGKSALFNRIAGRRIAIVHEEAGVTRDRVSAMAKWRERTFEVVDTGGIAFMDEEKTSDVLAAATRRQAEIAIEMASALVMVVDVMAGVTPLDIEIARKLRASGKPIFLAVNKCDNIEREKHAAEFAELGFERLFPIAAIHGLGVPGAAGRGDGTVHRLGGGGDEQADPDCHRRAAERREVVADQFHFEKRAHHRQRDPRHDARFHRRAVQLQGQAVRAHRHGGTAAPAQDQNLGGSVRLDASGTQHPRLRRGCVGVGCRRWRDETGQEDRGTNFRSGSWMHDLGEQMGSGRRRKSEERRAKKRRGRKKKKPFREEYLEALRRELFFLDWAPVLFVSAKTGKGVNDLFEEIEVIEQEMAKHIDTPQLNKLLTHALESYPPPFVHGKRFKVLYAFQKSSRPPTLTLFVNDAHCLTPHYERFLVDKIRAAWGFRGCPVRLNLRQRERRKFAERQTEGSGFVKKCR